MLRNKFRELFGRSYPLSISKQGIILNLKTGILKPTVYKQQTTDNNQRASEFTFLN
jgi:hypothetical protein